MIAKFLAKHYKNIILDKHDYKIKDLKRDVEEELKVNVGISKCKRERRMVLDAYSRSFTTEYFELKTYADEIFRSKPGSAVKVEMCREDLKEGRRIFKIMFLCLDACKKGWKASCRPIIGLDGYFLKTQFKGE